LTPINTYRRRIIQQHGATVGLPLFEQAGATLPAAGASRFANAPRIVPHSTHTRNRAFRNLVTDSIRITIVQQKVYDVIKEKGPVTNSEIAHALNVQINRVTGRTFELREYGLVVPGERRTCSITGMKVQTWIIS